MTRLMRIAARAAVVTAVAVGAPGAGADTTWTKISTDFNANIAIPSLGLTGTTAVVAWTQQTGPSTSDLNAVSFTTSPTQDVIGAASPRCSGMGADRLHTRALPGSRRSPAADLQRHPLDDDRRPAERHGDDAPQRRRQLGGAVRRVGVELRSRRPAVLSGATPLVAGYATQGIEIFNAAVAHAPGASDYNLQPQLGGCCGYSPRMALDSAGHLWIAWYSNATGATGMYLQQLDPVTGAPIGAPALAPNSESSNNNSFGANLACAATCRLVYGNSPAAGPANTIVSWWPGRAHHDRQSRHDRAGRRARPRDRLPRGRAPLGRLVRRQDLPGDARRLHRRRRRGAGSACPRARRAAPTPSTGSPWGTTSCWRPTTPGTRPPPFRSRSS